MKIGVTRKIYDISIDLVKDVLIFESDWVMIKIVLCVS